MCFVDVRITDVLYLHLGYAVLPETVFTGGVSFSISFDFRIELNAGTLLAATGTAGSYMLCELVDGNFRVSINKCYQPFASTFPPICPVQV